VARGAKESEMPPRVGPNGPFFETGVPQYSKSHLTIAVLHDPQLAWVDGEVIKVLPENSKARIGGGDCLSGGL